MNSKLETFIWIIVIGVMLFNYEEIFSAVAQVNTPARAIVGSLRWDLYALYLKMTMKNGSEEY